MGHKFDRKLIKKTLKETLISCPEYYSSSKELRYVNWRGESKPFYISADELVNKYHALKENGFSKAESGTKRIDWKGKKYSLRTTRAGAVTLFVHDKTYKRFILTVGNRREGAEVTDLKKGTKASKLFDDKFMELNGLSLIKAFGADKFDVRCCTPHQFYYNRKDLNNKELKHISQIDGSSQYPAGTVGLLPDAHDALKLNGRIEPNKDYPFAFYLKSGMLKIYNELDTFDWVNSRFKLELLQGKNWALPADEDETVLMKASNYSLKETTDYFYLLKESSEGVEKMQYKIVLNHVLGTMHMNTYHKRLAHISAVALVRANQSILNKTKEFRFDDIIQISIDGLTYFGNKPHSDLIKGLGKYKQEILDADYKQLGQNQYMFIKDNKVLKFKHGGFGALNINGELIDIKDYNLKGFEDMNYLTVDKLERELKEIIENEKA